MKCTSSHVALLAVLMYGLSSGAYLLGEDAPAAKTSAPTVPEPPTSPAAVTPPAASPAATIANPINALPPTPAATLASPPTPTTHFFNNGAQKPDDQLKILELKNADASTTAEQLKALTADKDVVIVPDARTNSIIIRGTSEVCNEAEALVMKLDQTATQNPIPSAASRRSRTASDPFGPSTATLVAPGGATISAGNGTATMTPGKATISTGGGGGVSSGTGNLVVFGTGSETSPSSKTPGLETHHFHLKHANSNDVYNALMAAFKVVLSKPGAGVVWNLSEDKHVNDLVVTASKEDFPQIDALITQLDSHNPPELTIDATRSEDEALKLLSNADSVLKQAQSAQQLYNDMLQKVQTLPANKQQQFQTTLQQLQDIQRQLAYQTAAQAKLREDVARRNQELRKRYEELARRNSEDAEQLAKDQALQLHIKALADEIRQLTAKAGDHPSDEQKSDIDAVTSKLKDELSHQFDNQQKGESDELQQLRQRLDKLEQEISDRIQNRDKVIQQRLGNLISATDATQAPNSLSMPVRITTPHLILKNVPGGDTLNIDAGTPGTITITQPSANSHGRAEDPAGPVFEVHVSGPKAPKVGDQIQLKLTATNRGTVATPVLKIIITTIDGLVPDDHKAEARYDIGALALGESKELPLTFRVVRAGNISFSARVQGAGVPATATYSAHATPAETPSAPAGDS